MLSDYDVVQKIKQLVNHKEGLHALTLGELIDRLQSAEEEFKNLDNPQDPYVNFEWGSVSPTGFCSYRGDYSKLALETSSDHCDEIKLSKFLKICEDALGQTFEGWKGGNYMAKKRTDIYIANAGRVSNTRIKSIRLDPPYFVWIETFHDETF